jgi:hypothetical protein
MWNPIVPNGQSTIDVPVVINGATVDGSDAKLQVRGEISLTDVGSITNPVTLGWDENGLYVEGTAGFDFAVVDGVTQFAVVASAEGTASFFFGAVNGEVVINGDGSALFASGAMQILVDGSTVVNGRMINSGMPVGTLASPPAGMAVGTLWADTTTSVTQPIVRFSVNAT